MTQEHQGPLAKLVALLGGAPLEPLPKVEPITETVAQVNPELLLNDIEQRSDVHDWDGVADGAKWYDLFTAEQWADILDVHSMRIARERGAYSFAADLALAAECIRAQQEEIETLRGTDKPTAAERETEDAVNEALDNGEYRL